mmetsp:Transcript_7900/g.14886  ORF Transcript_7900/g.14886 Transcript_7900/m.14886 type:complete len:512 (+) Transcript_7900:551-2086(+)
MFADLYHGDYFDDGSPTEEDDGIFIPESTLLAWHRKMQRNWPQVFTPDDRLFGSDKGQHPYGTKLLTFFDDDPNKPMRCEVRGSKWEMQSEFLRMADNREPMYVVLINGEYSLIHLTNAHEEGGWKVDTSTPSTEMEESQEGAHVINAVAAVTIADSDGHVVSHGEETVKAEEKSQDQKTVKAVDDFSKISRECIECDAKDCTTRSPQYKCSRCHTVYYCSRACQSKHWKEHKPDCILIDNMRASIARMDESMPENTIPQFEKDMVECGICLQDASLANPVILPTCQHVFCFICIEKWKIHQNIMNSESIVCCPYCHAEIPKDMEVGGLDDQLCDRVFDLAKIAERRDQGSDERRVLCEEALIIVNQLIERQQDNVRFLYAKANTRVVEGGHSTEVVDLVSKILAIDKEEKEKLEKIKEANATDFMSKITEESGFPCLKETALKERMEIIEDIRGMLPNEIDMEVILLLATALEQDKNWKGALGVYDDLFQKAFGTQTSSSQSSEILIGMS